MPKIEAIYTDGACSGNPGAGGWGTAIYFENGSVQELGDSEPATTNNRMEMQAAIAALQFLHKNSVSQPVALHTDSEYLKKGITQWIQGWKRKGWKNAAGKPVLNQDLWKTLDDLVNQLRTENNTKIEWKYVRGHAGNPRNERCDAIARAFAAQQPIRLSQAALKSVSDCASSPEATEINCNTTHQKGETSALKSYDGNCSEGELTVADSDSPQAYEAIRINRLRDSLETLKIADEVSKQGYLITSAELADLMDVNASAVTSRGDYWAWRNWTVSRIRREGNQILWQLERIDE
ncbi:MAG: ribonuclease HI [Leptolyngbya sp. SIO4C1]|nr:ribonuclease HI [Leptolyngbya sp. SIO4C1]